MKSAITQRIALSGRVHRETAVLYNSFGIILTTARRLREALDVYRETLDIYRALGLGDELDAQIVAGNMGILEMRTGNVRAAETTLEGAIRHQRALAGNSAAVAAALGNYGKLFTVTGRAQQALPILQEATALGAQYAGPSSPVTVQNRLFLGQAQLATGDRTAARMTLTDDHDAAVAQYGANNQWTLRTQLALAQLTMEEGHASDAQAQLIAIIPELRAKGIQTGADLPQALRFLGEVLVAQGQGKEAIPPLQEAVTLAEQSGDAPWELALAHERLTQALAAEAATNGT
jgi:non-specific serine/threonine protein kinase/serine/threonine-protein kinase